MDPTNIINDIVVKIVRVEDDQPPKIIAVAKQGPQGIQGPQGPPGEATLPEDLVIDGGNF